MVIASVTAYLLVIQVSDVFYTHHLAILVGHHNLITTFLCKLKWTVLQEQLCLSAKSASLEQTGLTIHCLHFNHSV